MTDRRTVVFGVVGLGVLLLVGGLAVIGPSDFFLPERATQVEEGELGDAEVLKRGTFTGAAGHDVTGTVLLIRDDEGLALRFENYTQTQGPDVFVYISPSQMPDTGEEIAKSTKIRIDGGADGGESTKQGTFTQRLPDDVDPSAINGVGIWCEKFATPFGVAELQAGTGT